MNYQDQNQALRKELEDLSPGFPVRPSFQVPDHYFTELPDHVINRWRETGVSKQSQVVILFRKMAAAAIFAGLCLSFYWLTKQSTSVSATTSISSSDAYQYILDHYDEFEPLLDQQLIPAMEENSSWPDPNEIRQYMNEQFTLDELENLF